MESPGSRPRSTSCAERAWLSASGPADLRPCAGDAARRAARAYLDHSRDIGEYNAAFPRYEITVADDRAEGTVEFPVVYEGPPGVVHGGFLAVFFDCILQHLSCDMGRAGKTRSLNLRYRRPTPIGRELQFSAQRRRHRRGDRVTAEEATRRHVCCMAEMSAVLGKRENLPAVSPRRPS
ncbi:MAG: PaaI family thioesterase [Acidimicrobiia bacterium]